MDRYKKLYELDKHQYADGSPIIIEAGALLLDSEKDMALAQMKFVNITNRAIKAIEVSLKAYDIVGRELQGIDNFQYLDLHLSFGETFGAQTPIYFPQNNTRKYKIKSISVIFEDNDSWTSENLDWQSLPVPRKVELNSDEQKQFKIELGQDAQFWYGEIHDLWSCSCGVYNKENQCYNCKANKSSVKEITPQVLCLNTSKRLEQEKIKNQIETEKEIKNKVQKKKKTLAALAIITPILLIIIVILSIVMPTKIIKKNINTFLQQRDISGYDEALKEAEKLNDENYTLELTKKIVAMCIEDEEYLYASIYAEKTGDSELIYNTNRKAMEAFAEQKDYQSAINIAQKCNDEESVIEYTLLYAEQLETESVSKAYQQYLKIADISQYANDRAIELETYVSYEGAYKAISVYYTDFSSKNISGDSRSKANVTIKIEGGNPVFYITYLSMEAICSPGHTTSKSEDGIDYYYDWRNNMLILGYKANNFTEKYVFEKQ